MGYDESKLSFLRTLRFYSALATLEPQNYVVVEQFGSENISLLSWRLVCFILLNFFFKISMETEWDQRILTWIKLAMNNFSSKYFFVHFQSENSVMSKATLGVHGVPMSFNSLIFEIKLKSKAPLEFIWHCEIFFEVHQLRFFYENHFKNLIMKCDILAYLCAFDLYLWVFNEVVSSNVWISWYSQKKEKFSTWKETSLDVFPDILWIVFSRNGHSSSARFRSNPLLNFCCFWNWTMKYRFLIKPFLKEVLSR